MVSSAQESRCVTEVGVWCQWLVTPKEEALQDQSSDEPGLSQKLKFTNSGRPGWHSGGLQPSKMLERVPCRDASCSSLLTMGSRRHLLPRKVEKWGFLEHPSSSPSCVEILGHSGNEEGKDSQPWC